MKKLLITTGIVLALVVAFKNSHWARSFVKDCRHAVTERVPASWTFDQVRREIANLDREIENRIRPLASDMVDIEDLQKDIKSRQAKLATAREELLTLTRTLEKGEQPVISGERVSLNEGQRVLRDRFNAFKSLQQTMETKQVVLKARQEQLDARLAQARKLMDQRENFERELVRLEAEQERLNVEKIASHPDVDSGRATRIKALLQNVERQQRVTNKTLELRNGSFRNINQSAEPAQPEAPVNLEEIRNYLQGGSADGRRLETVSKE